MKVPLNLPLCDKCGSENYVWINLHDDSFEYSCACGENLSGSLSTDITTGFKGLYRSEYELLINEDHILSMVLSAIALEWELVRLHHKWVHIDALEENEDVSNAELDEIWHKHRNIFTRIKETGRLLHPEGFEKYVSESKELRTTVKSGFPSLSIESLITDIHKNLFLPRNRILHYSCVGYKREDSIKSYNIAHLGIVILNSMDKYRRGLYP
jgi:hypothetical protein